MALDKTPASAKALNRHNAGDSSKFKRLTNVVQVGKGGQVASSVAYKTGVLLPLKKDAHGKSTDSDATKKEIYFKKLDAYLLNRKYGIFSHDAEGTKYAVVPKFLEAGSSKEFNTLVRTDTGLFSSQTFTAFIKTLKSDYNDTASEFYYATAGPFHDHTGLNWFVAGIVYKDNVDVFPGNPLGTLTKRSVQWQYTAPGSPSTLEFLNEAPLHGHGFQTTVHFITEDPLVAAKPKVNKLAGGYASAQGVDGFSIMAYHSGKDLLFSIVKKDQLSGKIDEITDMLEVLGVLDATFMDGGGSCFLYEYAGSGGGHFHVKSGTTTAVESNRDGASFGLHVAYGIRDIDNNT